MQHKFKKPKRNIHSIFLHCSATDNPEHDNAEFLRDVHIRQNGWRDIGYHYFINKRGDLFSCRDLEDTPAAQYAFNTGTLAICLSGHQDFTDAQFFTLAELLDNIQDKYSKRLRIRGHKEVAFLTPKDCPVFDYAEILDLVHEGTSIETRKVRGTVYTIRSPIYYLRPERINEAPEVKGMTIAAGAGGVAVTEQVIKQTDLIEVASQVQAGTSIASSLAVVLNYGPIVLGVVALAGLGYAFWKFKGRLGL